MRAPRKVLNDVRQGGDVEGGSTVLTSLYWVQRVRLSLRELGALQEGSYIIWNEPTSVYEAVHSCRGVSFSCTAQTLETCESWTRFASKTPSEYRASKRFVRSCLGRVQHRNIDARYNKGGLPFKSSYVSSLVLIPQSIRGRRLVVLVGGA